jgi:NAD-dependent histone deacetylase SIR2
MSLPPWLAQPDITFFGEKLTDGFDRALEEDRERVDLVLIIGTSLKVSPVAEVPGV